MYQLDDGRQVFLATVKGMPSPMADVTGTPEQIIRAQELFLSFNPAPEDGWTIPSYPEGPLSWETLVGQVSSAQPGLPACQACQILCGNTGRACCHWLLCWAEWSGGTGYLNRRPRLSCRRYRHLCRTYLKSP
ncbi:type 4b pilus protein PilO2 [Apirhabdus apintestini]|nr:type 4b pilus protein PilO2 [Enterobacteriaceae bacterium CA-0114]